MGKYRVLTNDVGPNHFSALKPISAAKEVNLYSAFPWFASRNASERTTSTDGGSESTGLHDIRNFSVLIDLFEALLNRCDPHKSVGNAVIFISDGFEAKSIINDLTLSEAADDSSSTPEGVIRRSTTRGCGADKESLTVSRMVGFWIAARHIGKISTQLRLFHCCDLTKKNELLQWTNRTKVAYV